MLVFLSCLLIFPYYSLARFCCSGAAQQLPLAVCWAKMCTSPVWLHSFLMVWFMGSFSLAGGGGERNNYTKTMCLARGFCLPPKQLQKILVSEQELVFFFFFLFEHLLFSGSFSAAGIKLSMFFCFSSGLLFPKLGGCFGGAGHWL